MVETDIVAEILDLIRYAFTTTREFLSWKGRQERRPSKEHEYWSRHVAGWQHSGLSKKAYCERHDLNYRSLRYWAAKPSVAAAVKGQPLAELRRAAAATKDVEQRAPIELVVGDPYVVRLWPSVCAADLREVLAALENQRQPK